MTAPHALSAALTDRCSRTLATVPEDDHRAWVIKCDYNGRYFWSLADRSLGGPITVARIHAERFPTRQAALFALWQIRAATESHNIRWRLVRLVTARPRVGTGEKQ